MKISMSYLVLILILFFLIILTLSNSCVSFKPSIDRSSFNYAQFENFSNREGLGAVGSGTAISTPASAGSIFNDLVSSPSASSTDNVASDSTTTKESFGVLKMSNYGEEKPLDIFSGTKGSILCDSVSSNLSNSQGGLCLNDMQQKMLRTRGGNSTGGDSQIGP